MTPKCFDWSAKRQRRLVPVTLRAPVHPELQRLESVPSRRIVSLVTNAAKQLIDSFEALRP